MYRGPDGSVCSSREEYLAIRRERNRQYRAKHREVLRARGKARRPALVRGRYECLLSLQCDIVMVPPEVWAERDYRMAHIVADDDATAGPPRGYWPNYALRAEQVREQIARGNL